MRSEQRVTYLRLLSPIADPVPSSEAALNPWLLAPSMFVRYGGAPMHRLSNHSSRSPAHQLAARASIWLILGLTVPACVSTAQTQPRLHLADARRHARTPAAETDSNQDTLTPTTNSSNVEAPSVPVPAEPSGEPEREETIEDGIQVSQPINVSEARTVRSPVAALTDKELEAKVRDDFASVGSMSVGRTNGGMLINGVQMPPTERLEIVDKAHAWGTQETIDALVRCIDAVHRQFPGSPKMRLGHISSRRGGHLSPHKSHQAGRDVDISYFYKGPARWYARANARNLDRARTWAFVRALITETDVEMILIDRGLQRLLKQYALSIGEDPAWLNDIFRGTPGTRSALIRHARGHATHIHVRFYSPIARGTAQRVYPVLIKLGKVEPPAVYVIHRARKGDTLGKLAKRYGTTIDAIRRANGLRSSKIRAKRRYRIPTKGKVKPTRYRPIVVPLRRLPSHPPKGE